MFCPTPSESRGFHCVINFEQMTLFARVGPRLDLMRLRRLVLQTSQVQHTAALYCTTALHTLHNVEHCTAQHTLGRIIYNTAVLIINQHNTYNKAGALHNVQHCTALLSLRRIIYYTAVLIKYCTAVLIIKHTALQCRALAPLFGE